jgi:hypothetical protein
VLAPNNHCGRPDRLARRRWAAPCIRVAGVSVAGEAGADVPAPPFGPCSHPPDTGADGYHRWWDALFELSGWQAELIFGGASATCRHANSDEEDGDMPNSAREKSTGQLAVWWRLVEALEQLGAAWQEAHPVVTTQAASQLPAHLVVALARAGVHGTEVTAGLAAVLAQQADTGPAFAELARTAQQVSSDWPRRAPRA